MYETQTNSNHTDHGAPDQLGSGSGAPPRERRRATKPEYVTLLENAHTRRLIASQLGIRVEHLTLGSDDSSEGQRQADSDLAELLEEFIRALRAV